MPSTAVIEPIAESKNVQQKFVRALDRNMAVNSCGEGAPLIFLHGNPTSSFLWRNVMAPLRSLGQCIAPDLIGMGDSDKLPASEPDRYRFVCHRRYLDALLDELNLTEPVTLVLHDWGSALGFDWARRNPERVRAIIYMEAIVRPISWNEWPAMSRPIFEALRSGAGEELIIKKNVFVEKILPASIQRELSETEMAAYRKPFESADDARLPTLTWPRELPIDGTPADVVKIIDEYASWLSTCDIPKLFINAEPGSILVGTQRDYCRTWPNQTEVTVPGIHFIQEDSAAEIAASIRQFVTSLKPGHEKI